MTFSADKSASSAGTKRDNAHARGNRAGVSFDEVARASRQGGRDEEQPLDKVAESGTILSWCGNSSTTFVMHLSALAPPIALHNGHGNVMRGVFL